MKLSEAMEQGFKITRPARAEFVKGGVRGGIPYACPIGAAYLCATGRDAHTTLDWDLGRWFQEVGTQFPELQEVLHADIDTDSKRLVSDADSRSKSLQTLIIDMVDQYRFTRHQVLKAVKELGY